MKKIIQAFYLLTLSICGSAQVLHVNSFNSFGPSYTSYLDSNKVTYANDSMFYMIRYGGIQSLNTNTGQVSYKYAGIYKAQVMVPDTGGNFILLKNDNQILRYSCLTDSVYDVSPQTGGQKINDIGSSINRVWAIINHNILGYYEGTVWHYDTITSGLGSRLLVKNDSTVYMLNDYGGEIYAWVNGNLNLGYASINADVNQAVWSIDTAGTIWIANINNLLAVNDTGGVTSISADSAGFNGDILMATFTDNAGHVWCAGQNNIYRIDSMQASIFHSGQYGYYYYEAMAVDKSTGKMFLLGNDSIHTIYNGITRDYHFGDMPYKDIKALGRYFIATEQGIFFTNENSNYNYSGIGIPSAFADTGNLNFPYCNDITCFTVNGNYSSFSVYADSTYGTHHGIYGGSRGINNDSLPDLNINYIYSPGQKAYIGTDKGLCIYNAGNYTVFDTSNSPLPSNKITFIGSLPYYWQNGADQICIGTDHGFAIYTNDRWKVFSDSALHLANLYVTGIAAMDIYGDSILHVSTLGNGMFDFDTIGNFNHLSKAAGDLMDDTLYYTAPLYLGYCGEFIASGTNTSGIAYRQSSNLPMSYDTGFVPYFHKSRFFTPVNWGYAFATDSGIAFVLGCYEGVKNVTHNSQSLKWTTETNQLNVYMPADYNGNALVNLYNLQGKAIENINTNVSAGEAVVMQTAALAAGIYIVQANLKGELLQSKVVIIK